MKKQTVLEVLETRTWRKAVFIGGQCRCATNNASCIGEVVENRTWKFCQIADCLLLAPKEEEADESPKSPITAENEARLEVFSGCIAAQVVSRTEPAIIRQTIRDGFHALIQQIVDDGVFVVDVHGRFDLDFGSTGPTSHKKSQFISRTHISIQDREKYPVFAKSQKIVGDFLLP